MLTPIVQCFILGPGGGGSPGGPTQDLPGFGQHWNLGSADGQVVPPGQQLLPAQFPGPVGHGTESPIWHVPFSWENSTATGAEALPQTQAGTAPEPEGLLVWAPLSLIMCSIFPLPFRNTASGDTNELSS